MSCKKSKEMTNKLQNRFDCNLVFELVQKDSKRTTRSQQPQPKPVIEVVTEHPQTSQCHEDKECDESMDFAESQKKAQVVKNILMDIDSL